MAFEAIRPPFEETYHRPMGPDIKRDFEAMTRFVEKQLNRRRKNPAAD